MSHKGLSKTIMSPDFALIFSSDTISLQHRAIHGWAQVSCVSLDAADLGKAMADLRFDAKILSRQGDQVKLVIPNDQIKYLTISDRGQTSGTLQKEIRRALEGSTPYGVSALSFDWSRGSGTIYIAAVANDALTDAEIFAKSHHFEPVCFAAYAPADAFIGEVFFGAAASWTGVTPQKDGILKKLAAVAPQGKHHAAEPDPVPEVQPEARVDPVIDTDMLVAGQAEVPTPAVLPQEPNSFVQHPRVLAAPAFAPSRAAQTKLKSTNTSTVLQADSPTFDVPVAKPVRLGGVRRPTQDDKVITRIQPIDPVVPSIGVKQRFLGLVLTNALFIFLLAVAAWASFFLDGGQSRLFDRETEMPWFSLLPDAKLPPPVVTDVHADDRDILSDGRPPFDALTPEEADARYAATGIWWRFPEAPPPPKLTTLDDLYVASIDAQSQRVGIVAPPDPPNMLRNDQLYLTRTDKTLLLPDPALSKAQPQQYSSGLVVATPDGAMNADGVRIFSGRPPVVPPTRPRLEAASTILIEEVTVAAVVSQLEAIRPRARPAGMVEGYEPTNLEEPFPVERAEPVPVEQYETLPIEEEGDTTRGSVMQSLVPVARPPDLMQITEASQSKQFTAQAPINLIGIYGKPPKRRALVRLSNGRFQKVTIGDQLDGGRVGVIGEGTLQYSKKGSVVVLHLPNE